MKRSANAPRRPRLALWFIAVAFVLAAALLGREVYDYAVDATQPALRHEDLWNAVRSVLVLAFLTLIGIGTARKPRSGL